MTHSKTLRVEKLLRLAQQHDLKHVSIDADLLKLLYMDYSKFLSRMVKAKIDAIFSEEIK